MKFAYKLQELRKGKGLSQEEFAELLGVSRQSVSKWESGRGYPEIDKLIYISNYFNTSLDLLLKGNDEDIFSTNSYKSKEDKKSKSKKIVLTKPNIFDDNDEVENVPIDETSKRVKVPNTNYDYITDPIPIKKKDSMSLKRLSVPTNEQLRTKYSYTFGSSNSNSSIHKKFRLSKHGKILVGVLSGLVLMGSIMGIVGYLSSSDYIDDTCSESTTIVEASYDEYFDGYYSEECYKQLFLNYDANSQLQKDLIATAQDDIDTEVYTQDGNMYYTNLSVVSFYSASYSTLIDSLSCSQLYSLYKSVLDGSNGLVEVYSPDYDSVTLISTSVLSKNGATGVTDVDMDYQFNAISLSTIYSDPQTYYDDSTNGVQSVKCISLNKNVRVSYNILDVCYNDMYNLKHTLHAKEFVSEYESLSLDQNCEEVLYNDSIVLIPKEYILVSVSEQNTNSQTVVVAPKDDTQDNDNAVEQAVQNDIVQDDDIS